MKRIVAAIVLGAFAGLAHAAKQIEQPVPPFQADCTTTTKIQFLEIITVPGNMNLDATRESILLALGKSTSNPNWAAQNFNGQWYYEYGEDEVLYSGLSIRSHYLRLAIHYDDEAVSTIVCDSTNLDQTEKRIHKKVPLWKARLDSRIRMELGRASEAIRTAGPGVSRELADLQNLRDKGLITDAQFEEIKESIVSAEQGSAINQNE
jgi:hypothetical protein